MKKKNSNIGLTVIELLVVLSMLAVLLSFSSVFLLGVQRKGLLTNTINRLVIDIREQQLKAMVGDTGGTGFASGSGIYFSPTSYVLYPGTAYDPLSSSNYTTNLEGGLEFNPINFPGSQLHFTSNTGTVSGYIDNSDTIVLKNSNDTDQKTVKINRLGVVISIN